MLKSAFTSPKIRSLAARLGIPFSQALGLCGMLWNFTADHAPQGDVGRHDDVAIAMALEWTGDPEKLVTAFVVSRLLDKDLRHRLVVHDWHEHCPRYVHAKLAKANKHVITNDDREESAPNSPPNAPFPERSVERSVEPTVERSTVATTEATTERTTSSSAFTPASSSSPAFALASSSATSMSKAANREETRSPQPPRVCWSELLGWTNVTEADLRRWKAAYPAIDVEATLERASAWLVANPTKRPRSNFPKFLVAWMARDHDAAAAKSAAASQRAAKPPRKGW